MGKKLNRCSKHISGNKNYQAASTCVSALSIPFAMHAYKPSCLKLEFLCPITSVCVSLLNRNLSFFMPNCNPFVILFFAHKSDMNFFLPNYARKLEKNNNCR